MKRLVNLLFTVLVLAVLAWALWRGFTHRPALDHEEAAPAAAAATPGDEEKDESSVTLAKEKQEALGLVLATLQPAELPPQCQAFGRVLDPAPLVALEGDLASAEAALVASRAESERSQKLLAAGENTSRKLAETAEAAFRSDEIKLESLRRRAALQWGSLLTVPKPAARQALVEQIVRAEVALVRVDVFPGDAPVALPRSARLLVLGRENAPILTETIFPATEVDPRSQAPGFLLRVEGASFPLRPGMALTAWLTLPGAARAGFALPRSAVLRHDGRTWIYAAATEGKFVRQPVELLAPLPGEGGWFIAALVEGSPAQAPVAVVITGAASLLSEELKKSAGLAEE